MFEYALLCFCWSDTSQSKYPIHLATTLCVEFDKGTLNVLDIVLPSYCSAHLEQPSHSCAVTATYTTRNWGGQGVSVKNESSYHSKVLGPQQKVNVLVVAACALKIRDGRVPASTHFTCRTSPGHNNCLEPYLEG
jgi:hypothetical protein